MTSPVIRPFRLGRLRKVLPEWLSTHPILAAFAPRGSLLLHGSLTMGVNDRHADLDIWMFLPCREVNRLAEITPLRFFDFSLDGRPGHVSVESFDEMDLRVRRSYLGGFENSVTQLRSAVILSDPSGTARRLVRTAQRPMRRSVRQTLFFHHYVQMRGEHRSVDNPLSRGDRIAVLLAIGKTIAYALRAAMVLDGVPPPYDKWLARAARNTSTGRRVERHVRNALRLIEAGALRTRAGGNRHPVQRELRMIRTILVEAAERRGIRGRWLREWWLSIDSARRVVDGLRW